MECHDGFTAKWLNHSSVFKSVITQEAKPVANKNFIYRSETDLEINSVEEWYSELEKTFDIEISQSNQLRSLCDAKQNLDAPIYSWFNLKEAFSSRFPVWVIQYLASNYNFVPKQVLDPFCGGGTTIVALSQQGIDVVGVEYNPFIASIAKTKASSRSYDAGEIRRALRSIAIGPPAGKRIDWPNLSTLKNQKYFRRGDIRTFLFALKRIEESKHHNLTKQFLRIGLAAAIDDVANLRKDGRALRYVKKQYRPFAKSALLNHCKQNLEDIKHLQDKQSIARQGDTKIWAGSALNLKELQDPWDTKVRGLLYDSAFDLILYSPPYLNNFDYSEIYKLELWLLGFIDDYQQWRKLRRSTIRSHHSVKFDNTCYLENDPATTLVYEKLRAMGESNSMKGYAKTNMPPVILGYFDDMYLALKEQYRVLKPGGYLVYLVANSRHSDLPVATDVILGEIGRLLGFEPLKLIVLHKRNGRTRQKRFLRESIVILRKPEDSGSHKLAATPHLTNACSGGRG